MRAAVPAAVPILINASAGRRGSTTLHRLVELLRIHGIPASARIVPPGRIGTEAGLLAEAGAVRIGVAGGDGTLRSAAEALAGRPVVLAALPTGTLNHFAQSIGIPDLEAGVRRLAAPGCARIAVGIANDHLFLNTATFGMYGQVVRQRDRLAHYVSRWPAAAIAFTRAIWRLRWIDVSVQLPSVTLERATPLLGARLGANRSLDAAELELAVLSVRDRADVAAFLVRRLPQIARGVLPAEDARVEAIRTRSMLLAGRDHARLIDVTLDGEAFRWKPPFFVAIADAALAVATHDGTRDGTDLRGPR